MITLGEIQRELLRLMNRLSSYPLQYLRNVAYTNFHVIGIPTVRLADYGAEMSSGFRVPVDRVKVQTYRSRVMQGIKITDKVIMPDMRESADGTLFRRFNPCVNIREVTFKEAKYRVKTDMVGLRNIQFITDDAPPVENYLGQYQNSDDPNYPDM